MYRTSAETEAPTLDTLPTSNAPDERDDDREDEYEDDDTDDGETFAEAAERAELRRTVEAKHHRQVRRLAHAA